MTTPAPETLTRDSPFRGLGYYSEVDAAWFFGRETERKTIIGNLRAARLTLLYAESGVGKTSLLRAGVASRLGEIARQSRERGFATLIPVVFSAWKDDPVEDLIGEIERQANSFRSSRSAISLPRDRLDVAITAASDAAGAKFLIMLDQFEEYFGQRPGPQRPERVARGLADCVTDPKGRANFLIAIREDAYARLGDLFAGHKVNVYGNYLHLRYLDRAAARAAIERPIEHFNAIHTGQEPVELEPDLTDAVLNEVHRGRLVLGQGGQNGAEGRDRSDGSGDEIEAPFLQLVMTRLWDLERAQGSRILRKATLDDLGGAGTIVRTHLDSALAALPDEQLEAAAEIFHDLVTPSGAKIPHTAADLAKMTGQPTDRVALVLEKLDASRIVRAVDPAPGTSEQRYEVFHDRLAAPLLDWVGARDNDRLRLEARAERRRANIFRALAIGTGLLFVLALGAVVFAEIQKARANRERRTAQSLQLAANAQATLDRDPELSTLLALQALRIRDTAQAEQALRAALPQLRVLATIGGGGPLSTGAFSRDGKEFVTASSANGTARIWSTSSHRQLGSLAANGYLRSAAFSPDGKKIVISGVNGPAQVWSADTRRKLGVLGGSIGLYSAAFSPDGKEIVTASQAGAKGDTTQIWSARNYDQLGALTEPGADLPSGNAVYSAAFSPDGKQIVTASADGAARVWSVRSRHQVGVLTEPGNSQLYSAAFSPDGKRIVTASQDGTARIWSARSHAQLGALTEPGNGQLYGAEFSPDGREIVTASQDGTARIWSSSSYQQVFALAGHTGSVRTAAFSPNARTILTASKDGTAKLWNASPLGRLGVVTEPGNSKLYSAGFSPDGLKIVTASKDGTARIWSATRYELLRVLAEPHNPAIDYYGRDMVRAAFSPNGRQIVTASSDGVARSWRTGHSQLISGHAPPLLSAAFSPDGTRIVTSGADGTARIWSSDGRRRLGMLTDPGGNLLYTAVFSPNGKEIVTAGMDGVARIWSANTYHQLGTLSEPDGAAFSSAAFSPDGQEVVTASTDGTARIWNARSDAELGVLTEPGNSRMNFAAFSPDGKEIATASQDGTVRLWSTRGHDQLTVITVTAGSSVNFVSFSPDGRKIVTASDDGTALIFSTELAGSVQALERIAKMRVTRALSRSERQTYLEGI